MTTPTEADRRYANIVARLEGLPQSRWHVKARVILGVATFFDAFDLLALSSALPVLAPLWKLAPPQIGALIAWGFIGQLIGALFFGWLAERVGRLRVTIITVFIFGLMSIACAYAWNIESLTAFRVVQGMGLGGEIPVAAAYINELARSRGRGRFFVFYEAVYPMGILAASVIGLWTVPTFGWQSMFFIGAVPALLAPLMTLLLPESPRWLAQHARFDEAEAALARIENEVGVNSAPAAIMIPARTASEQSRGNWVELFSATFIRRTLLVWICWFAAFFVTFGFSAWLPTVYRTVYKLPLAESLRYGLFANLAGLVLVFISAFAIDRVGRRLWMSGAFLVSSIAMLLLVYVGVDDVNLVVAMTSVSYAAINSIAVVLYLYTPEIYPTRIRAFGTAAAAAWRAIASAAGPFIVGLVLPTSGISSAFFTFGCVALVGMIAGALAIETKERLLEDIAR